MKPLYYLHSPRMDKVLNFDEKTILKHLADAIRDEGIILNSEKHKAIQRSTYLLTSLNLLMVYSERRIKNNIKKLIQKEIVKEIVVLQGKRKIIYYSIIQYTINGVAFMEIPCRDDVGDLFKSEEDEEDDVPYLGIDL